MKTPPTSPTPPAVEKPGPASASPGTNAPVTSASITTPNSKAVESTPITLSPSTDIPGFLSESGQSWPNMSKALKALQMMDPVISQKFVTPKIPGPNLQLTNTFLMFMSALRGGDIRGWFGEHVAKNLERTGHKQLLSKLATETIELAKLINETPTGEWRAIPLPFFDGKALHQIWIFTRQQNSEETDGEDTDPNSLTRFVIELDLSAMGSLQLDGLVQKKRFDLILRSRKSLPPAVRQDLSRIMAYSMEVTGFDGTLVFHTGDFPIDPRQELENRAVKANVDEKNTRIEI